MILLGFIPLIVLGGVIAAVVFGFRSMIGKRDGTDAVDGADAAKSAALHIGLFLAMIACAVGLIDLLQAAVEGDRIAGSNPDIARGLSLLIVGAPVFVALLRVIDGRYAERAALGDRAPHRGWTVYLVAALTTTLVATLTSVVQVTESLTSDSGDFRPEELMQLVGWLALWAVHWFVLRPRYRVRGEVHLAIGSIIGLGWLITGVGAVVYRILDEAYLSAFDHTLTGSYDVTFWIVFGLVGAAVWIWHWHLHLNAAGSIEGDRRRSPVWFFTVVVAGVLPGLIAMLVAATTMVSGVLIWFIGSTDQDAADFFEPATILTTVLTLGFLSWAYHRWELDRGGEPQRNESLRFHDYVVLATGLVGVVGATAVIIGQLFAAVAAEEHFVGSLDVANTLIVAVTVLLAAAAVWWRQWALVERHRAVDPVDESGSIWRKLYLITAFGIGGLVLSVSAIWVLFVLLRDLLDSQGSHDTLEDLTNPVGWGVAVLGAVWYHLGVWRVDREVLAGRPAAEPAAVSASPIPPPPGPGAVATVGAPPPPGAATAGVVPSGTIMVRPATAADHGAIFTLQRAAAATDAVRAGTLDIPALRESFPDASSRLTASETLVAVDGARLVGALVRPTDGDPVTGQQVLVAPDQNHDRVAAALAEPALD